MAHKNEIEQCDCNVIHEDIVKNVNLKMPSEKIINSLANFFKVFGDDTRIKILSGLSISEMCVCDIAVLLNMTQSAISHQLKVLKKARLVKFRREGKVVYYSLDDEHVNNIFNEGFTHINEINN